VTRARGNLSAGLALALAGAGTTWVAMFSWRGFVDRPGDFLAPLLLVGGTIAAGGALGRWWRVPLVVVFLGQVLLGSMMLSWVVIGTPFPVGAGWTELMDAFDAAVDTANTYAAPLPQHAAPVSPLLIAGGLGAMLLVDLLACTLRRVPLAGLPLLTVYSVPLSLLEETLSWWVFLFTAVGFLTMLFLHETDQISRWGRPLGRETSERDVTVFGNSGTLRSSAGKIGGFATALAVVVPVVIPTITLDFFDLGVGGGGNSEIQIKNPMTDLQRDLKRAEDLSLLTVTTNDPDPDYLRIAVLNRFNNNEWSSGDRDVPRENRTTGPMPNPPGLATSVPRDFHDYEVQVTDDFESRWLPTQPLISEIQARGDWRYDESTMDFIASDDDLTTAGMSYSMVAVEPDFEARMLASSTTTDDDVKPELLDLPPTIPQLVRQLALGVTRDAPTKFQKGVALQQWFREDGGFTYDLRRADVGNGVDALEEFLSEDGRVGYCEQFASAMAVMARVLDIPARVAVGFLSPRAVGGNTYEYSSHDLHAWPELYFQGAGWVRFEPTPSDRASNVPDYTAQRLAVPNPTVDPTNPTAATGPTDQSERRRLDDVESPEAANERDGAEESGFPWLPVGGGLAGALLLGAAMLGPGAVRRSRRERRLDGGPESAWEELWATAVDLRLAWPDARSPRQTREWMVDYFGAPDVLDPMERPAHGRDIAPEAVDALDRIVRDVELLRYSRGGIAEREGLRDDVLLCLDALQAGALAPVRRRARWWPRSVLRSARAAIAGQGRREVRFDGVAEHI
jgi:transglutaminase-like putative cysteine protease